MKVADLDFGKLVSFAAPRFLQGRGNAFEQDDPEQRKTACRINNVLNREKKKETSSILNNSKTTAEVRIARAVKSF